MGKCATNARSQSGCTLLLLVIAPFLVARGAIAQVPPPPVKDILFINSYNPGYEWSDSIYDAFKKDVGASRWNTRIWVEYLDSKRFSGPAHVERFRQYLASKYKGRKFDLLFTSDDDALLFVLGPGKDLFGETPVVFCGVNDRQLALSVPRTRMTGLVEVLGSTRILDIAFRWHPSAKRVWVVSDATPLGENQRETFAGMATARPDREFIFVDGAKLTLDAILDRMRQVRRDDIVILTAFARDSTGTYIDAADAQRRIALASPAPVYSPSISSLGQGIVGGGEQGGAHHGHVAAGMALQVLGGTPTAQIPIETDPGTTFVFDYSRLTGLGISEDMVPRESRIVNRPTTTFERYRTEIIALILFVLGQAAVIALLASNVYRRRAAQKGLAAGNLALKDLNRSLQEEIALRQGTEESLRTLREQFWQSQKMEAVGRLAGGVAHDFNNLLTVINGFTGLALRKAEQGETAKSHLEQVRQAGEQAARLTQQLLTLSRRQVVKTQTLDLHGILENTLSMLRRVLPESIQLVANMPSGRVAVETAQGQIEQVLLNLVVNARDAMPDGGTLTLDLQTAPVGKAVAEMHGAMAGTFAKLSVSDTGFGIDDNTAPLIFEPFFTTKPEGKGTGLGLSTVYGIARQNGGWIEVQSRVGEGSTFTFWLPLSAGPVSGPAEPEQVVSLQTGSVLVVEDQKAVRELAVEILMDAGFAVVATSSAMEALEVIRKGESAIHVLLTDVVMPTMSGRELAEQVRQLRPELRILYMSGYPEDVVGDSGVLPGAVEFIAKPFRPGELVGKVKAVLGRNG